MLRNCLPPLPQRMRRFLVELTVASISIFLYMPQIVCRIGDPYGNFEFLRDNFSWLLHYIFLFHRNYSLFQFENMNGFFKSYVKGTREICAQIIQQTYLHEHLKVEGDHIFRSELARSVFDFIMTNRAYFKTSVKCLGNVTLAGPSKTYHLNQMEKQKINLLGIELQKHEDLSVPSYKHLFISKLHFEAKKNDDLLNANYLIASENKLYVLEKCLEVNNEAVLIVHKVITRKAFTNCKNIFKVTGVSPTYSLILAKNMTPNTFFCLLNKTKQLHYIFKVLCSKELE